MENLSEMQNAYNNLSDKIKYMVESSDIVVVEGYEMVGKSYFLRMIKSQNSDSLIFRPNWERLVGEIVSRGNMYLLGISAVDMYRNLKDNNSDNRKLLIDRWMISAGVYRTLYNQVSDCNDYSKIVKAHEEVSKGLRVVFFHFSHKDLESAKIMYSRSLKDSYHKDDYDKFSSFESYWESYNEADSIYREMYKKYCKFPVYVLDSSSKELIEII